MNRFYVYGWYLSDGTCFYVGKGTGDRYRERSRRNEYWINIVTQEEREGRSVSVKKLHEGLSEQDALSIEENLIKQWAPKANLTLGGQGPTGYRHTVEALQKTGSAQKALWQEPEYRAHMVEVHTGHTHTEETKAKIGAAHKGQKRPEGTGEKIALTKRGKPRSEETKAKIRATLLSKRGSVTVTGTY
jgi:hypothetical protein